MNGLDFSFTPNDHNSFLSTCSEYVEAGRYYTYTWADEAQIPLVQFTRTLAREHNCYPEEFRLAWDLPGALPAFLKTGLAITAPLPLRKMTQWPFPDFCPSLPSIIQAAVLSLGRLLCCQKIQGRL